MLKILSLSKVQRNNCGSYFFQFSSSYLTDMKKGRCNLTDSHNDGRLSELARRNSLYPAHLQSTYAAETQFFPVSAFSESDLRRGSLVDARASSVSAAAVSSSTRASSSIRASSTASSSAVDVKSLTARTAKLGMDSPASNTRSSSRKPLPSESSSPAANSPRTSSRRRRDQNNPAATLDFAPDEMFSAPGGSRKKATPTRGRHLRAAAAAAPLSVAPAPAPTFTADENVLPPQTPVVSSTPSFPPPPSSGKRRAQAQATAAAGGGGRKRRSVSSVGSIFNDSRGSVTSRGAAGQQYPDVSATSMEGGNSRRLSSGRSYSRPGPPTPAKRAKRANASATLSFNNSAMDQVRCLLSLPPPVLLDSDFYIVSRKEQFWPLFAFQEGDWPHWPVSWSKSYFTGKTVEYTKLVACLKHISQGSLSIIQHDSPNNNNYTDVFIILHTYFIHFRLTERGPRQDATSGLHQRLRRLQHSEQIHESKVPIHQDAAVAEEESGGRVRQALQQVQPQEETAGAPAEAKVFVGGGGQQEGQLRWRLWWYGSDREAAAHVKKNT